MSYITTSTAESEQFAIQNELLSIGTRSVATGAEWLEWEGVLSEIDQQELISLGGKYFETAFEYLKELAKHGASELIE